MNNRDMQLSFPFVNPGHDGLEPGTREYEDVINEMTFTPDEPDTYYDLARNFREAANAIGSGFIWSDSPEGGDFWSYVCCSLDSMADLIERRDRNDN